jgi:ribonuclease HII
MLHLSTQTKLLEAGCDEAGRGCYAGPVFAAAVILPKKFKNQWIDDSKKLSSTMRNELRTIIENESVAFAVARVEVDEIDKINILKASIKAMHLAIDQLHPAPQFLAIDGNRFYPYNGIPHQTIIKGDGLYLNIASASILAKSYRDEYMQNLHQQFPEYGWHQNKGYGTLLHRNAIEKYGLTMHHRKSFNIMSSQSHLF